MAEQPAAARESRRCGSQNEAAAALSTGSVAFQKPARAVISDEVRSPPGQSPPAGHARQTSPSTP